MNFIAARIADRKCPECGSRLAYLSGTLEGGAEYEQMRCSECGETYDLEQMPLTGLTRIIVVMCLIVLGLIALIWWAVAVLGLSVNAVSVAIALVVFGLVGAGQVLAGLRLRRQKLIRHSRSAP